MLLGLVMLGLLATVGPAPGWTVLALAALVGLSVPMTSGGFTSLLPRLVPDQLLPRAHAVEGVSFNASAILGPAAAATLAFVVSPAAAVASIAGFAALSLVALAAVPGTTGVAGAGGVRPGFLPSVRRGLAHLARTRPLRGVTVATSTAFVGVGMLTVALPLHADQLAGDAALGGYVWTAVEVGAVATAVAWGRWHDRWRPERVVLASLVGYGLVVCIWPVAGSLSLLLGLALVAGLAGGAGMPALFTTRQRYTPAGLYGQISTTGASLKLAGFAAGATLGGQLTPALGSANVLTLVAVIHLLAAALGAGMAGPGWSTRRSRARRSPVRLDHSLSR